MSTAGRAAETDPAASDVAAELREAGFVRLVARADGDALAATGLLARALGDVGVPFEASVARTDGAAAHRLDGTDGQRLTLGLAVADATAISARARPASVTAYEAARELGADPDPLLALAGAFAAGEVPGQGETAAILDAAAERIDRGPGVAVPTDDRADGLAHSTLLHAGFSGRPDDAAGLIADARAGAASDAGMADDVLDAERGRRRLASLVAIAATSDQGASDRAATALERALRPHATTDGPFATVGGYADVLDALARAEPGTGVALALGSDVRTAALSAWREHATRVHGGLREATTGRYDGLLVARVDDAPVGTAARLLADFRSPEPVAMAVTDGEAAVVAEPDATPPTEALRTAADSLDGDASTSPRGGCATFDGDAEAFVKSFREAGSR